MYGASLEDDLSEKFIAEITCEKSKSVQIVYNFLKINKIIHLYTNICIFLIYSEIISSSKDGTLEDLDDDLCLVNDTCDRLIVEVTSHKI